MTKPALFTLTLLLLAPLAHAAPPDRCSTLDEYGYPSFCEPIGWRLAPYWNDEVCCDDEVCVESTTHGCAGGMRTYFCKYAELDALGHVQCMFPVPHYCDEYPCLPSPEYQSQPVAELLCCEGADEESYGPCAGWNAETGACDGTVLWCDDGICNDDGTITCYSAVVP